MRYGMHPHYESAKAEQYNAWRDEIERMVSEPTPERRDGARILPTLARWQHVAHIPT